MQPIACHRQVDSTYISLPALVKFLVTAQRGLTDIQAGFWGAHDERQAREMPWSFGSSVFLYFFIITKGECKLITLDAQYRGYGLGRGCRMDNFK